MSDTDVHAAETRSDESRTDATRSGKTQPPPDVTGDVEAFAGAFLNDLAAVAHAATVVVGDKLGLYRIVADVGPATAAEIASRSGCDERYITEWLAAQAASNYCHYDPHTGRFHLDAAQRACLADESSPAFLAGGMAVVSSMHKDEGKLLARFRSGEGLGWHEHHQDLFTGTERFFRPAYVSQLVATWLPALSGVTERLQAGGRVADVGCGHGASTIELARAFPGAEITGFDYHEPSIATARTRAVAAGVQDRARFEVAPADGFPGSDYDLVCTFDALHDMGDPIAAASHIRQAMSSDGTWLLVEPLAGDRLEDNLHLLGRIFYSASTLICTPASRAQRGAMCLGAQAGPARLREVVEAGGFSRFRVAVESPTNLVLEVRP